MEYFKTCLTCKGTGKVSIDSYCAEMKGIYTKLCPDCKGNKLQNCTQEIKELKQKINFDDTLLISVQSFIDELKDFKIIK